MGASFISITAEGNKFSNNKLLSNIYLWSYLCLLVLGIFKSSNLLSNIFPPIFNLAMFGVIFINVLLVIISNFKRSIFPCLIVIIFFAFLVFHLKITSIHELLIFLMCYNANLLNNKRFVKYNLLFILIPTTFIMMLNLLGEIPNVQGNVLYIVGEYKGATLGFNHPNTAGEMIIGIIVALFICLDYAIYTHYKHSGYVYIITMSLSLFISIIMYNYTKCRELLCFGIISFALLLFINTSFMKKIFYILVSPLIIFVPSMVIYWGYHYNPLGSFYMVVDQLFSERLSMQHLILTNYPVKLIQTVNGGPNINEINNGTVFIDDSFVALLEADGIISVIVAGIIILRILLHSIFMKSYIICVIILSLIICSCIASSLFDVYLDSILIYACSRYSNYSIKLNKQKYHRNLRYNL